MDPHNRSRSVGWVAVALAAVASSGCLGASVVGGPSAAAPTDVPVAHDLSATDSAEVGVDVSADVPAVDVAADVEGPCRCRIPNAEVRCGEGGACEFVQCRPGHGDCNDDLSDGCEANLATDALHCGACGAACRAPAHATVACVMGACGFGRCAEGYADCDRMAATGCEVDTRADPAHCGACNNACAAPPNAVGTCDLGVCGYACAPGFADCDGDRANGCEVDTRTTVGHCGACGSNCATAGNASAACVAGRCEFGVCNAGFGDCDGDVRNGCEASLGASALHCGRCGNACATGEACSQGVCAPPCPAGQTRCAGACVPLANDPAHCGACGNACGGGQLCGGGSCVAVCGSMQTQCGRSCVDTARDALHCGRCNNACPAGQSCVSGACALVCPAGQVACGGRCAELSSDPANCGGCGVACPPSDTCVRGACALVCPTGQAACGRRCVSLDRDPDHCGACNNLCVAGCVASACARPIDAALSRDGTCALYSSGRVFCLGRAAGVLPERVGVLRQSSMRQITDSINRPLEDVVELAAGEDRACARRSDGSVACFGDGGTVGSVAGVANAVSVSGRGETFFAVTSAGTVLAWNGLPRSSTMPATAVSGISDAVEVAAGGDFACIRRRDGTVSCWGGNAYGQLGNGTTTGSTTPAPVRGLTSVTALAAGRSHACALRATGAVLCWGRNQLGQLGNGTTANASVPGAIASLGAVRQVRAGMDHTCALSADGLARCWGANAVAQLGNGLTEPSRLAPVTVSGLMAQRAVAANEHHSCAVSQSGELRCWGDNPWGEAGGGTESRNTPARVMGLTDVLDVQSYTHPLSALPEDAWYKCALQRDGRVLCWSGGGASGLVLGDGSGMAHATPVAVAGLTDATQLSVGASFACALRRGGTVSCWGANSVGQLGVGNTTNSATPVAVTGLTGVAEVRVGTAFGCARTTDMRVACWGYNYDGQLGRGATGNAPTPAFIASLAGARALVVGHAHACALMGDGRVRCWGQNTYFQLGDGTTTHAFAPIVTERVGSSNSTPLYLTGVDRVATQYNVTWARVTGMGAPQYVVWGQTSPSTTVADTDPDRALEGRSRGALGFGVTCAVSTTGTMTCAGNNEFGQLGAGLPPGSTGTRSGTVAGAWSSVEWRGDGPPCAVSDRGEVLCWGPTRFGYLRAAGLDSVTRAPARIVVP